MNLSLSVVSAGAPNDHVFGSQGGRFGRSANCEWVLPDPDRILSSYHGRISFIDGKFVLSDTSTNGIFVDGDHQPIGPDSLLVITDGLRLRAGNLLIEARLLRPQAAESGFADLVSEPRSLQPTTAVGAGSNRANPAAANPYAASSALAGGQNAESALRQQQENGDLWGAKSQDPLAYLGGMGKGEAPATAAISQPIPQARSDIPPEYFNLPETDKAYSGSPESSPPQRDLPADNGLLASTQGAGDADTSLRDLFPSGPAPVPGAGVPAPVPPAVNATPPQSAAFALPEATKAASNLAIPEDYLASLGGSWRAGANNTDAQQRSGSPTTGAAAAQPQARPQPAPAKLIPDNFDPLTVFGEPAKRPSIPPPAASVDTRQPPMPSSPERSSEANPGANVSPGRPRGGEKLSSDLLADIVRIERPSGAGEAPQNGGGIPVDPVDALKMRRVERRAALLSKATSAPSYAPSPAPPVQSFQQSDLGAAVPGLAVAPVANEGLPSGQLPAAAVSSPSAEADLLETLFNGMGFSEVKMDPDRQRQVAGEVGTMVRAISEGLVQLLVARNMLKIEFRMDETQVSAEENNPFKYFKIPELALDELFLTRSGGFQSPSDAVTSAFADIQHHVMLSTAAMQRALTLMFHRMSPDTISRDAEEEGGLRIRGLGGKKGKWETFIETHSRMSGNIDEIARQIIAEAFAQVQEEQARRVSSDHWEKTK